MSKYDIEMELSLYRFREFENEDLRLEIEELNVGDGIGSISYNEKVQTSIKKIDNGYTMDKIEFLKRKIKLNEIAIKRVDNILSMLKEDQREIVKDICIDKISINKVAEKLYMSRKSVKNKLDKALDKIRTFNK